MFYWNVPHNQTIRDMLNVYQPCVVDINNAWVVSLPKHNRKISQHKRCVSFHHAHGEHIRDCRPAAAKENVLPYIRVFFRVHPFPALFAMISNLWKMNSRKFQTILEDFRNRVISLWTTGICFFQRLCMYSRIVNSFQ